ncbi:MAG: hypothetical protein AAGI48_15750 [Verrucomicrobiota bacterium]
MSPREKKLLIFFLVAIFAVVNLFGFNWLQSKRQAVQGEISRHEETLAVADSAIRMRDTATGEIDWLKDNLPEPKEGELVPSQLESFVTNEATRNGLTVLKPDILENDESGQHFHRARFDVRVTGQEAALYRWLVRLQSPREFRGITALRLSPNREDDTLIDAKVQVDQWFVPMEPET